MKAIREVDLATASRFIVTKQCKSCKKEIPIQEEICPECKANSTNAFISSVSGVALAFSIMFCILGFFMPTLWIISIISVAVFIAVNKFKPRAH